MIIYKAVNKITGDFYIGMSTKTLEKRRRGHQYDAKRCKYHFYNAINKYGFENFEWSVIDNALNLEDLKRFEQYWISILKPNYNMTAGGDGSLNLTGRTRSEETRNKISAGMKGITRSEETRNKISAGMKGKTHSEEHRRKLREAMKGKIRSEETRNKISAGMKGKIRGPYKKKESQCQEKMS